MSNAERKLISNAAEGLQVYVTDYDNGSLMIFDGSNWNVFSKTTVVDDTTAPVITSTETGINLQENSGADQTIYTITATDAVGVASYAIAGNDVDAGYLLVDSGSGVVTFTAEPDYETKTSYSFTVTASDDSSNTSAATTVTFAIINVDEVVPTITSGVTGTNKAENSGAGQMIYTIAADANDGGTIASCAIAGTDAGLLSVNAGSGVVTLTADANYETKNSYSFTVTATDAAGTSNATTVAFYITNVDEVVPTITSGTTGTNKAENSGAGQTIYTIAATANDGGTIASYAIAGTDVDAVLLSVNAGGVVTLTADPDYETKPSYSFTVTASDAAGTSAATTVTFAITNVDEVVPTITSGATGTNKAENSGAGQTIYTITADANDGGTIASYAISGTDAALLSVNAGGVVTLTSNPDYETKNSYSFTVTATDAAGTSNATTVTFSITNVDEVVPTITSGATGTNKAENSGAGQTIYTIAATANDGGTIASYAIAGTDAALLSVNAGGVVTLTADPDYENKSSYSFTVTATDAAGTTAATTVTFSITDVNEIVVEVGDSYEGGIVFYLAPSPTDLDGDGVNDTGLIYANSNYTTTKSWNSGGWCSSCSSISTSTAIGTGATNTTAIINEYGSGTATAAGFARAYNGGGFNDWFLPSTLEQDALINYFIEKYPASGGWSEWGGIRSNVYWSSTQHDGNQAKQRSFNNNTSPQSNNKSNAVRIIPIRAF